VGSGLVNGFSKLNYNVYGLDKNFNYIFIKKKNIHIFKKNILQIKKIKKVKDIDYFIHNAAITNPKKKYLKKKILEKNLLLTQKSLNLALELKAKNFSFISSTSIYRSQISHNYSEKSKIMPKDNYSKSKILSEKFIIKFCKVNNLNFNIFRLGNLYSSIEKIKWSRNQLSAIKRWVDDYNNKKILKTESFKMNREWTYLADIPKVIHSIFNSSKNNLNILNLVSPYIISDLEVMKIIETNKRMQKLFVEKNPSSQINNATYSIYIKKFNFNKWTSPKKGIKKIKNRNNEKI